MRKIGEGEPTSGQGAVGILRKVETLEDVLRLMETDLSETIVFTPSASVTAVTPILPKIRGIICASGGFTSHLAIVAREFDLPCLMGSRLEEEVSAFEGRRIRFTAQGEIFLEEEA
jgi:phosphohistidine swiveling domain-containing protein